MNCTLLYFGMDGSSTDHKLGGGYVENIMISAGSLWRNRGFRLPYFPMHRRFFLDSGGYNLFFGGLYEYPFTPERYAGLCNTLRPDFAAVMDYPCEPDLPLGSVEDRIHKTVRNTVKCLELPIVGEWVPVIQGWTEEDYRFCLDLMEDGGLLREYMAVGSVCRRGVPCRIISSVHRYANKKVPGVRLHFFGLKITALDSNIGGLIYSCDTQAWKWGSHPFSESNSRLPASEGEKLRNYEKYLSKVNLRLDRWRNQTRLIDGVCGGELVEVNKEVEG